MNINKDRLGCDNVAIYVVSMLLFVKNLLKSCVIRRS